MPEKLAIKISASGAASVFQTIRGALRKMHHKPSLAEAALLVEFAKHIDERRVFSAPYTVEVVQCCVESLSSFRGRSRR